MKVYTAHAALDLIAEARETVSQQEKPVIMATVVKAMGSNPQDVGARMLVFADGTIRGTVGGGRIEARILKESMLLRESDKEHALCSFKLKKDLGMVCGGVMDIFLERIDPAPHVLIFGGGHVAAPTAMMAVQAGFRVSVIDERVEWANRERFPSVHELHNLSFPSFLENFEPMPHHYILLLSKGHATDTIVLEKVIGGVQKYTGMIGSKQKASTVWKHLRGIGVSEEDWKEVHCPVGLPLGGSRPSEIAVSIVSQLVQVRYQQAK